MIDQETQAPNPEPLNPAEIASVLSLAAVIAAATDAPAPLPGKGAPTAREPLLGGGPGAEPVPGKTTQNRGLKRLRNPNGQAIRAEHGNWGNPNRKRAAKIKARRAWYDANHAGKDCYHRPGGWKK